MMFDGLSSFRGSYAFLGIVGKEFYIFFIKVFFVPLQSVAQMGFEINKSHGVIYRHPETSKFFVFIRTRFEYTSNWVELANFPGDN